MTLTIFCFIVNYSPITHNPIYIIYDVASRVFIISKSENKSWQILSYNVPRVPEVARSECEGNLGAGRMAGAEYSLLSEGFGASFKITLSLS